MKDPAYGKFTKRVVFTATEHQHAQLLIRLKQDGLRQSDFFRSVIDGYTKGDARLCEFIQDKSTLSQKHKVKSNQLKKKGESTLRDLGFEDGEVDDLFDIIAEEHPDL